MSDVSYVVGTTEYLIFELEVVAPELTFTASEWRAMVALCPAAEPFDPDSASWNSAVLETIDGRHYIKLLTGTGGVAVSAGTLQGLHQPHQARRRGRVAGHPRRRPDPLRDGLTATASLDAIPDNREVSA